MKRNDGKQNTRTGAQLVDDFAHLNDRLLALVGLGADGLLLALELAELLGALLLDERAVRLEVAHLLLNLRATGEKVYICTVQYEYEFGSRSDARLYCTILVQ